MFKNYKTKLCCTSARARRLRRNYSNYCEDTNDEIQYANRNAAAAGSMEEDPSATAVPRIKCPETNCKREFPLDYFGKHLALEHFLLKMTDILPKAVDSFCMNVALFRCSENYCVKLFMLRDKNVISNCRIWKEHVPIVLMCMPITGSELKLHMKQDDSDEHMYLMLWFTGNTSICTTRSPVKVEVLLGYGKHFIHKIVGVYGCNEPQEALSIYESGCAILLSSPEIAMLCKKELIIEVQVIIE